MLVLLGKTVLCTSSMLVCSARRGRWAHTARVMAAANSRPTLEDVERLTRGEAAKKRGTGSRTVPHRLNEAERLAWDLAKKRGYVVLSGTGYRRERKGSPLSNSWRQFADALGQVCIQVQNGSAEPLRSDAVVVDLSPLRADAEACRAQRDACLAVAALAGATLARDDCDDTFSPPTVAGGEAIGADESEESNGSKGDDDAAGAAGAESGTGGSEDGGVWDHLLTEDGDASRIEGLLSSTGWKSSGGDGAIWTLPPIVVAFDVPDRAAAKALAEGLCAALHTPAGKGGGGRRKK